MRKVTQTPAMQPVRVPQII